MSDALTVFLFDVDGVIVEPLGYRAGITQTLKILMDKIGIENRDEILPTESEISYMESCGLHDVWDITNIFFATVLISVVREKDFSGLDVSEEASLSDRLQAINLCGTPIVRPHYELFADLQKTRDGFEHPSAALIYKQFVPKAHVSESRRRAWEKLLAAFLLGTRSPYKSYGTRLFQNIILGGNEFEKTYNLKSEYTGPSLLKQEDKVAIKRATVEAILRLKEQGSFRAGVYTARPSLPPLDLAPLPGYSPEAELALEASGMSELPLVGMGSMEWLAQKHNRNPETLTKPHTTQALSALLAAVRGSSNSKTLELAYDFVHGQLGDLEELKDKNLDIYVFEDTISGIIPMQTLGDILSQKGYQIEAHALGIATDDNKIASLEKVCTKVFPNVNDAFEFAFKSAGLENSLAQK